jgi:fumarate reductase flavoprotein subunit
MPPDALQAAVTRYNADVARGTDTQYFKAAALLEPVLTAPFYGTEVKPGIISFTRCGLRVDPDGRVLDVNGTPIPGLYAAGETTGSVHGKRYPGGGNRLGPPLTFGRIAGATAAAEVRASSLPSQ